MPTLRSPNDTGLVLAAMQAMSSIMVSNTQFAIAGGPVLINDDTALVQERGPWPALYLEEGPKYIRRVAYRLWKKEAHIFCHLLDRWDQSDQPNTVTWNNLLLDMQRMQANLEDNPRLVVAAVPHCEKILTLELQGRTEDEKERQVEREKYGAFPVIKCTLQVALQFRPYPSNG